MILLPIESKMEIFARTYSQNTGVSILVGASACTDGKNIWVPPIPDQSDPYLRLTTEMFTYHETGHVKTKDFPAFEEISKKGPKSKATVFNIVRDVVVEHTMETEYPGMKAKWAEFLKVFISKRTNKEMADNATPVLRKLLITLYIRCREQQLGTDLGLCIPKKIQEVYDAKLAKFVDPILKHRKVGNSADLTEQIYEAIKTEEPPKEKENKQNGNTGSKDQRQDSNKPDENAADQDGDKDTGKGDEEPRDGSSTDDDNQDQSDSSEEKGDGDESHGSGGEGDDQDDDPTAGSDPSDGKGSEEPEDNDQPGSQGSAGTGDEPTPDDGTQADAADGDGDDPLSKEAEKALKKAREELDDDTTDGKSIMDDAADQINKYVSTHHIYRDAVGLKDDVIKPDMMPGWEYEVNKYEEDGRKMTGYSGQRMKVLFISEKAPRWQANLRSGKLDTRKLHRLTTGCQDVCKRKLAGVYEDSAVWLVTDHSGSMTTKKDIAQALLTSLASDLDKMRIPFGAVGFTSAAEYCNNNDGVRTSPCHLTLLKDFEEPYRRVRHRFVWPRYRNVTAELPAIRFGAYKLAERRETKKVLFILTDGRTETGNPTLDSAMREATKEFIDRLIRAGVKVVGIGILDSSMSAYCPDFILVEDLTTFAVQFYSKLTKLIL